MKSRFTGIIILIVIIIAGYFIYSQKNLVTNTNVSGIIGSEKEGLLEDEEVKKILTNKYGFTIDYKKSGSIDMVKTSQNLDFLFPSSEIAVDIFKRNTNNSMVKNENIFHSPMVFYTWDIVCDSFIKQEIVQKKNGVNYLSRFDKFIQLIIENKKWSDIGLNQIYGSVKVISTDPSKSNSGVVFYSLIASLLNNGEIVDSNNVEKVLPILKEFNKKMGYLEDSSSKLFDSYITKGVGENPIIVGYENQIIEFAAQNPEQWEKIKNKIRILYPMPTVWSTHSLIITDKKASNLAKAFSDKEIQNIAWNKHGFRSAVSSIDQKYDTFTSIGIPTEINSVVPLPKSEISDKIIKYLFE